MRAGDPSLFAWVMTAILTLIVIAVLEGLRKRRERKRHERAEEMRRHIRDIDSAR